MTDADEEMPHPLADATAEELREEALRLLPPSGRVLLNPEVRSQVALVLAVLALERQIEQTGGKITRATYHTGGGLLG